MIVNKCHILALSCVHRGQGCNKFRQRLSVHRLKSRSTFGTAPEFNCTKHQCIISEIYFSNSSYRGLSRYSASTIMRPYVKSFSFTDYDVIGFDLDGTVLRYNLNEIIPLEYNLLARYLIENKGYSNKILQQPVKDVDFFQKGLFLDGERGNILKLNPDGYILKANHGTKRLTDEEVCNIYGDGRQWSVAKQFISDPMSAWNGPLANKVRSLLDYFDCIASLVFARAVDDVDERHSLGDHQPPYTVWPDLLDGLVHLYTRENFSNGKSEYFQSLKSDPERYLLKTKPDTIHFLRKLRSSNKLLFLLTGSHIDFANFTSSYALGNDWRDLFDVVVCYARKPGFFNLNRPFCKIEGFQETDTLELDKQLDFGAVYSGGNWEQLVKSFACKLNKKSKHVKSVYVGDNLIQDVFAPASLAAIDSVAVSEEMLAEHSYDKSYTPEKFNFKYVVGSDYWNSYFYVDCEPTLWTSIISKYSKMCIPTLDHIAVHPVDHRYNIENKYGFYPAAPLIV